MALEQDVGPAVAFRAGPPISEFDDLLGRFAVATDQRVVTELTTDLDRFAYDQALSVFLCAPQALYAVNRHVAFDGYAATFELAETQVARSTGPAADPGPECPTLMHPTSKS
jgi:hypothetical protein